MRYLILLVLFSLKSVYSQDIPLGYIVQYQEEFAKPKTYENILMSGHCQCKTEKGWYIISEKQDSTPVFYPAAAILLDNHIFGEYIVSMRINPKLSATDSTSAIFLLFGLRDSLNYYFVEMNHLNTRFCRMYKGEKTTLVSDSTLKLISNKPVTLNLQRDILKRSITINQNGDEISFSDPNLVMGYFGMGVENSVLAIDKITIWAPTSIQQPAPVFRDTLLIK